MIQYRVAKVQQLSDTTKHPGDYRTKIISSSEMPENRPLTGCANSLLFGYTTLSLWPAGAGRWRVIASSTLWGYRQLGHR